MRSRKFKHESMFLAGTPVLTYLLEHSLKVTAWVKLVSSKLYDESTVNPK